MDEDSTLFVVRNLITLAVKNVHVDWDFVFEQLERHAGGESSTITEEE